MVVVVVDLLLSSKSSSHGAKPEFASYFFGKNKRWAKRRTTFFFFRILQPIRACHNSWFFWGQVSINEECECATHQSFLNTSFTERSNICHAGLEPVMASSTPKGKWAGVFGQDQTAGLLNYFNLACQFY